MVIDISLEYNILSKFTSFLVVANNNVLNKVKPKPNISENELGNLISQTKTTYSQRMENIVNLTNECEGMELKDCLMDSDESNNLPPPPIYEDSNSIQSLPPIMSSSPKLFSSSLSKNISNMNVKENTLDLDDDIVPKSKSVSRAKSNNIFNKISLKKENKGKDKKEDKKEAKKEEEEDEEEKEEEEVKRESKMEAPKVIKKDRRKEFSAIVLLQEANGSWKLSSKLCELLEISIDDVKSKIPKDLDENIWITIITIKVLLKKFTEFQDEYDLLVQKSKNWILKNSKDSFDGFNDIIEKLI